MAAKIPKSLAICLCLMLVNMPMTQAGILSSIVIATGTITGTIVAGPAALAAIGFTAGGIAAGSVAASMMSAAATAGGGGVAAGGVIATLQSAAAVGAAVTIKGTVAAIII